MSKILQNFYKSTLTLDWTIGTGNFYVSAKPTPTSGWLVISPNNAATREIVTYTNTGTDVNGDYVTVSARGVGGTSEQTHTIGEPIRMNVTAEYWADMVNDIADIVASGVSGATTTSLGGGELATSAEIDAGTATSGAGNPLLITPDGVNGSHNIPFVAPGTTGNYMRSNGTDWVSETAIVPTFFQIQSYGTKNFQFFTSTQSGSNMYGVIGEVMYSIPRNTARTFPSSLHSFDYSVAYPASGTNYHLGNAVRLGDYLYVIFNTNGTTTSSGILRFTDEKTLATQVQLTISGGTLGSFNQASRNFMYTDGTFLYCWKTGTTWEKFSISGTTATFVADVTAFANTFTGLAYDNTNVYTLTTSGGVRTLNKYSSDGTTLIESRVVLENGSLFSGSTTTSVLGITIGTTGILYMIVRVLFSSASTNDTGNAYYLIPISSS